MSPRTLNTPKSLSIGRAATVFVAVGPAMGAVVFAIVFTVLGVFNMGIGAPFAAVLYVAWMLPWLYLVLGAPFLLTGVVYAVAARRYGRPSLLMAVMVGAGVFTACLCLLYLLAAFATAFGLFERVTDTVEMTQFLENLATLIGAMAIGVPPSWWLLRDPSDRLRWI